MSRISAVLLLLLLATFLAGGTAPHAQAEQTATLLSGPSAGFFATSPDGAFAVLNRSQSYNGASQVYSVPIGGGTPILLSPPGTSAGLVTITADSQSVVYFISGNTPLAGVYLAPIGGGDSIRLNVPVPSSDFLTEAYASPNQHYVVYHVGHAQ